jgi:hypothetical protein
LLDSKGIEWLVAPYEADAQLAALALSGLVDAVLTEDSDLLCYGCPNVLYKLLPSGRCSRVQLRRLGEVRAPALASFTHEMFRAMCVLSGCDYAASLPGVGLKRAHQLLLRHRTLEQALVALKAPEDYAARARLADLTFCHQRVWDVQRQCLTTLYPLPPDVIGMQDGPENDYLGPFMPADVAFGVCSGALDPSTRQPFVDPPVSASGTGGKGAQVTAAQQKKRTTSGLLRSKSATGLSSSSTSDAGQQKSMLQFFKPKPAAEADFKAPRSASKIENKNDIRSKLNEFREQQQATATPPNAEEERVLAPQTPEKPALVPGGKVLLGNLLHRMQARNATPQKVEMSPVSVVVQSKYFASGTVQDDDGARRVLLESLEAIGAVTAAEADDEGDWKSVLNVSKDLKLDDDEDLDEEELAELAMDEEGEEDDPAMGACGGDDEGEEVLQAASAKILEKEDDADDDDQAANTKRKIDFTQFISPRVSEGRVSLKPARSLSAGAAVLRGGQAPTTTAELLSQAERGRSSRAKLQGSAARKKRQKDGEDEDDDGDNAKEEEEEQLKSARKSPTRCAAGDDDDDDDDQMDLLSDGEEVEVLVVGAKKVVSIDEDESTKSLSVTKQLFESFSFRGRKSDIGGTTPVSTPLSVGAGVAGNGTAFSFQRKSNFYSKK